MDYVFINQSFKPYQCPASTWLLNSNLSPSENVTGTLTAYPVSESCAFLHYWKKLLAVSHVRKSKQRKSHFKVSRGVKRLIYNISFHLKSYKTQERMTLKNYSLLKTTKTMGEKKKPQGKKGGREVDINFHDHPNRNFLLSSFPIRKPSIYCIKKV